jgi:biotin transporter BioY
MFVICVATSGLRDVCFMFLFNGSMFPFLFRVLVTLISVYTFSVCYFCGFVTFDLNIFLHLIKKIIVIVIVVVIIIIIPIILLIMIIIKMMKKKKLMRTLRWKINVRIKL